MISLRFPSELVAGFAAVLVRVTVLVAVLPFLGHRSVPVRIKVGLSLALAVVLFPVAAPALRTLPGNPIALTGGLLLEAFVGLTLGLIARLIFDAVIVGGQAAGMMMGLGMESLFDPMLGERTSIVEQLQSGVAFALFLALDGHHEILRVLARSFDSIPLLAPTVGPELAAGVIRTIGRMLVAGLSLGAPLIALLLVFQGAMGVIARTVPQMGIFFNLGMVAAVLVGLALLVLTFPAWVAAFGRWQSTLLGILGDAVVTLGS